MHGAEVGYKFYLSSSAPIGAETITETAKRTLDADRCDALADAEKKSICKQML